MDFNVLVEELASRVAASLAQAQNSEAEKTHTEASACSCGTVSNPAGKPALLLLPQEQTPGGLEDPGKTNLDKSRLKEKYHLLCAVQASYQVNLHEVEAVILYGLNNEALGKVASGIYDSPYTSLLSQAILSGKKIYILRSQIELFQYEKTAPVAYFSMMREKLTLLERSGLIVCGDGKLEDTVMNEALAMTHLPQKPVAVQAACNMQVVADTAVQISGTVILEKRLVTEQDMAAVCTTGVTTVQVSAKAIVTALARDYAQNKKVAIIQQ